MTDILEPYSSDLITGGAIHKVTREFRPIAGEDEHSTDDWVHNPNATLVANDYWKLNVAEDALVEMTTEEKAEWDIVKFRAQSLASNFGAQALDPVMEPVIPGASKVVANDRPAIEVNNGVSGWAAMQSIWRKPKTAGAKICVLATFVLKSSGTGTKVRICGRVKAQHRGQDTSGAFADTVFEVATVSHTTVGEAFERCLRLDASSLELGDAVALQVGRDGNNEVSGTGDNDDVSVPIQLIGVQSKVLVT